MGGRIVLKLWLLCGVLSSLLYVAMNVFVPMQWQGYSSASRVVSELSAVGAPTRSLWVALGVAYALGRAAAATSTASRPDTRAPPRPAAHSTRTP